MHGLHIIQQREYHNFGGALIQQMRDTMGLRENKKTLGVNKVYRETSRSIYPFHKPVTTNISRPWLLDAIDYIKRAGTPKKNTKGDCQ
jgi:hypothetical protein